jgi:hypothetical protein
MLYLGEEAAMRYPKRIVSLLVLLLTGVVGLPLLSPADADPGPGDWTAHLTEMNGALARGDGTAVSAAWREAYVAAHVSRGWTGMIAVGDAAMRAGQAMGAPQVFAPRARRAYLTALLRARRNASAEGVLAAGAAFGRLGDRDAERLARDEADRLTIRAESAERRRARAF